MELNRGKRCHRNDPAVLEGKGRLGKIEAFCEWAWVLVTEVMSKAEVLSVLLYLSTGEATLEGQCPVLYSSIQKRCGKSPTKGHKNVVRTGASFSRGKAERAGTGQPGEEKAQRESDQCV